MILWYLGVILLFITISLYSPSPLRGITLTYVAFLTILLLMDRRFNLMSSPDKAMGSASPFLHRNASKLTLGGFFGRGKGDIWHRHIALTATDHNPVNLNNNINLSFPWNQLQQHTESTLSKKGPLTQDQKDEFLASLIRKPGPKDIAIAACGHELSVQAMRGLLCNDLYVFPQSDIHQLIPYLRTVLVASHVSSAINLWEVQSAQLLFTLYTSSPILNLATTIHTLLAGFPADNLLYFHVLELARKALLVFVADLKLLEDTFKWTLARSAVQWLSMLTESHDIPNELLGLLHEVFPQWRAWSIWKPDTDRIVKWELFADVQRNILGKLLALEGPDFLQSSYASLREAESRRGLEGPTQVPRVSTVFELSAVPLHEIDALVDRLLKVVDAVCINCPFNTPLLAYFCIGKGITNQPLELLECLNSLADSSISITVAQIFKVNNETEDMRVTAASQLLPFISTARCRDLRLICMPHISMIINGELSRRKKALENQLQPRRRAVGNPPWIGAEIKLQNYVASLATADWLLPLIKYDGLAELLEEWPSVDDLKHLHSIRIAAQNSAVGLRVPLLAMIDGYYMEHLVKRGTLDEETRMIVKSLIYLWGQTSDWNKRGLALLVAEGHNIINASSRRQFIAHIPDLNMGTITRIHTVVTTYHESGDAASSACVELAALLVDTQTPDMLTCWRPVLYNMAADRGSVLVDYALGKFKVDEWIRFLRNVRVALGGQLFMYDGTGTSVLSPEIHKWAQRLNSHLPTITILEKDITLGTARQCLMFGGDSNIQHNLEQILSILSFDMKCHNQSAMYAVVPHLKAKGENSSEVLAVLDALVHVSQVGVDACLQLIDYNQHNAPEVSEVILAGWLTAADMNQFDEKALEEMAILLGVRAGIRNSWDEDGLKVVADYLDAQYALIHAEAQRLDSLRVALKAADPVGTSILLAELDVEDVSQLEAALSDLPPQLLNVVEKVGEREVEMLFPLTHLTPLQRRAIGVEGAQSLLLRLMVGGDGMPPGFCMHLDTESDGRPQNDTAYFSAHKASVGEHSPWMMFEDEGHPYQPICHGKDIPIKFQCARLLHRHLLDGFKSLEAIHNLLTNALQAPGALCIICGSTNGTNLRRATVCKEVHCSSTIAQASLDVRLSDIRTDPLAIDLFLTAVFSAAKSNNLLLLPGCPFASTAVVIQILNSLPSMVSLSKSRYLESTINALGTQAQQLLTWVCAAHRGYIASATGLLKIPSMPPGTHQFVLASASPEKESEFLTHINRDPTTRLLFHGTTPDRLFSILCQGLAIKSNTPLQTHGAASGAGIYMAEDPRTSWAYTGTGQAQSWPQSALKGFKVLLGCENAGPSVGNASMHVIRDPSTVMVRYVFLVPTSVAQLPVNVKTHIDTAVLAVFRGLRSGAY